MTSLSIPDMIHELTEIQIILIKNENTKPIRRNWWK